MFVSHFENYQKFRHFVCIFCCLPSDWESCSTGSIINLSPFIPTSSSSGLVHRLGLVNLFRLPLVQYFWPESSCAKCRDVQIYQLITVLNKCLCLVNWYIFNKRYPHSKTEEHLCVGFAQAEPLSFIWSYGNWKERQLHKSISKHSYMKRCSNVQVVNYKGDKIHKVGK